MKNLFQKPKIKVENPPPIKTRDRNLMHCNTPTRDPKLLHCN